MSSNSISVANESMQEQYLTFTIGAEEYGIEIRYVYDIIPIPTQPITPVPSMPDYIKGIINQRGIIVPIIDVRMRFGRACEPYNERTCIIVVHMDDMSIGMVVDTVQEVLTIHNEELATPPKMGSNGHNSYVNAIGTLRDGDGVVLLLDIRKLFYDDELAPVSEDELSTNVW